MTPASGLAFTSFGITFIFRPFSPTVQEGPLLELFWVSGLFHQCLVELNPLRVIKVIGFRIKTINAPVIVLQVVVVQIDIILCLIILKKVNSLLIELGPLAVKCFLLDLKADLLAGNGNILGSKRDTTVKVIDDYCQQHLQKASNSFYLDVSDET